MPTNVPITVWCVYVNSDKLWEEEFRKHLSAYTRQGLFTLQSVEYPAAVDGSGARPARGIRPNDLVLVLISPDLLGCGECMDHIESLLARRRGNPSLLIPVLVRPVPWKASRLGVLQPLPASGSWRRGLMRRRWSRQPAAHRVKILPLAKCPETEPKLQAP